MFWYGIRDRTRTHLNATVRWTVAPEGLTEGNIDYLESYIVHHRQDHPKRVVFFFWYGILEIGLEPI